MLASPAARTLPDAKVPSSGRLSRTPLLRRGQRHAAHLKRSRQCPAPDERTQSPTQHGKRAVPALGIIMGFRNGALLIRRAKLGVHHAGPVSRQALTAIVDRDPAAVTVLIQTNFLLLAGNLPSCLSLPPATGIIHAVAQNRLAAE